MPSQDITLLHYPGQHYDQYEQRSSVSLIQTCLHFLIKVDDVTILKIIRRIQELNSPKE